MAQAKRRKAKRKAPAKDTRRQYPLLTPPPALVAVVRLAETILAHVVTTAPEIERQCWWRNTSIEIAADELHVQARTVIGGMGLKAGPGEYDVMTFGNFDLEPQLPGLFHVWGEVTPPNAEPWLVDLTPPFWREHQELEPSGLPPIQWAPDLPSRIVVPRSMFPRRFHGMPAKAPPGWIWYGNETRDPLIADRVLGQVEGQLEAFRLLAGIHARREAA